MNIKPTFPAPVKAAFLFAALILTTSCIRADDIRIVEVERLGMETMTKPVVTIRVLNDTRRNIQVLEGRFTISSPSGRIGEVMLTDEVSVPKKSETSITLPLRVRISNPLAAAALISGSGIDTGRLSVTGSARVKAGAAKKNFTFDNVPFSRIVSIFGSGSSESLPAYEEMQD